MLTPCWVPDVYILTAAMGSRVATPPEMLLIRRFLDATRGTSYVPFEEPKT